MTRAGTREWIICYYESRDKWTVHSIFSSGFTFRAESISHAVRTSKSTRSTISDRDAHKYAGVINRVVNIIRTVLTKRVTLKKKRLRSDVGALQQNPREPIEKHFSRSDGGRSRDTAKSSMGTRWYLISTTAPIRLSFIMYRLKRGSIKNDFTTSCSRRVTNVGQIRLEI